VANARLKTDKAKYFLKNLATLSLTDPLPPPTRVYVREKVLWLGGRAKGLGIYKSTPPPAGITHSHEEFKGTVSSFVNKNKTNKKENCCDEQLPCKVG